MRAHRLLRFLLVAKWQEEIERVRLCVLFHLGYDSWCNRFSRYQLTGDLQLKTILHVWKRFSLLRS
jgi:hypothetical protein